MLKACSRLVEQRLGGEAPVEKLFWRSNLLRLLRQPAFRRGKRGAGRAQRVQFVLRIELGQDLIGLDLVADIDHALDDPPADAKGERNFLFRLNGPVSATDWPSSLFWAMTVRTGRGCGASFGLPVAACRQQRDRGQS